MTNVKIFISVLFACLFLSMTDAQADSDLRLNFSRTGTDVSSVQFVVVNEKGELLKETKATMTCSHHFRPTKVNVTDGILCPNINGNSRPTIKMSFEVTNLPTELKYDKIGLDLHALSGISNYQHNDDGIKRQFNINVGIGMDDGQVAEFGKFSNIDLAANVGTPDNVHKIWTLTNGKTYVAKNKVKVDLTITAGDVNEGCFIGLSKIVLTTAKEIIAEPAPKPEIKPLKAGIYRILWKNTTDKQIGEENGGTLAVKDYDVTNRIFWELIPTQKENCFYVRNTATGKYIGSCNKEAGPSSIIRTSENPVEYYIGLTKSNAAENRGCYYFSSTDCPLYDQENQSPLALNKDGQSDHIITWQAGMNRYGSYWKMVESEDFYEVRPFMLSEAVGKPSYLYTITSSKGKALEMDENQQLNWKAKNGDNAQNWYFVGKGNRAGGYLIVNAKKHQTLNLPGESKSYWYVMSNPEGMGYLFRPYAKKDDVNATLKIAGDSIFEFRMAHTDFARHYQVYELPCGSLGLQYVEHVSISGDIVKPMQYPMSLINGKSILTPAAAQPTRWYSLFTQDQATVIAGRTFDVNIKLNDVPLEGQEGFLYFDWNHDGIFETRCDMNLQKDNIVKVIVPDNVTEGKTRMRFRLTENGLSGAEDEVIGQVFDCVVNIVESIPENPTLTLLVNDKHRGEAVADHEIQGGDICTIEAKPYGDAQFVCWREGRNVVSLDAKYSFDLVRPTTLIACFSPNTEGKITGIKQQGVVSNQLIEVNAENSQIKVTTTAKFRQMMVFTPEGRLVAQSKKPVVKLNSADGQVYIVKVYTEKIDKTVKILAK